MNIDQLKRQLEQKITAVRTYVNDKVPVVVGVEAVKEFKENFDKESFDGKRWPNVKRRDPNSPWFGHTGQTGKKSQARTTAKILSGETGELRNATTWRREGKSVIISNDKEYAAVHNEGLQAKVYGKKTFTMPRRQFIGATDNLKTKISDKIKRDLQNIISNS